VLADPPGGDVAGPGRFLDKEWMDVGRSGSAGEVVWVAYGDLGEFNEEGNEESGIIKAVRCRSDLSACTAPITLSTGQRVAEYPSVTIGHDGRTYITWERCTARVQETICEDPKIMLTWSADQGRTWSTPRSISAGGDNYFPELDVDPATGPIVGAWYTNRFDPIFHNRQDVELVRLHNNGTVARRQRVTQDLEHRAWVHYNANERHVALLGEGLPVPQQDNYLTRLHESPSGTPPLPHANGDGDRRPLDGWPHPFALAGRPSHRAAQRRVAAEPFDQDQPDGAWLVGHQHHLGGIGVALDASQHRGLGRTKHPCRPEARCHGRVQLNDQPVADLEVHGSATIGRSHRDRRRWERRLRCSDAGLPGAWLCAATDHQHEDRQEQRPQSPLIPPVRPRPPGF
jgi:hypothetical protein